MYLRCSEAHVYPTYFRGLACSIVRLLYHQLCQAIAGGNTIPVELLTNVFCLVRRTNCEPVFASFLIVCGALQLGIPSTVLNGLGPHPFQNAMVKYAKVVVANCHATGLLLPSVYQVSGSPGLMYAAMISSSGIEVFRNDELPLSLQLVVKRFYYSPPRGGEACTSHERCMLGCAVTVALYGMLQAWDREPSTISSHRCAARSCLAFDRPCISTCSPECWDSSESLSWTGRNCIPISTLCWTSGGRQVAWKGR